MGYRIYVQSKQFLQVFFIQFLCMASILEELRTQTRGPQGRIWSQTRTLFRNERNDEAKNRNKPKQCADFNLSEGCFPIFLRIFLDFIQNLHVF